MCGNIIFFYIDIKILALFALDIIKSAYLLKKIKCKTKCIKCKRSFFLHLESLYFALAL